jgi:signal transduction histidine kinase
MILNLIENGVKYSPSGGQVTLSLHKRDGRAEVVVEDNGPGIAEEHLPHIFDRFYRGDSRNTGGSGLGLSIARWIADSHGGTIGVKSDVGKGTVFTVSLPLGDGATGGPAKAS